jgi:hypothetical protein
VGLKFQGQLRALWAPEGVDGEGEAVGGEIGFAAGHSESLGDLISENAVAVHALAPFGIVEFAIAHGADAVEDFVLGAGRVNGEPLFKKIFYGVGQTHDGVVGEFGASIGGGLHDGKHFVVGQARNDRRGVDADIHARVGQHLDGGEPLAWTRGSRFHDTGQGRIQSGDGKADGHGVEPGEFAQ